MITSDKIKLTTARLTGVWQTFADAVNKFNAHQWDDYGALLDENAVAYNLHTVDYLRGRQNIVDYFRNHFANATFDATNVFDFFPPVYALAIRGIAEWTHPPDHNKAPIRYEFQFAPGTFLLTSVWAAHAAHPTP
jgi:hypothetical protein